MELKRKATKATKARRHEGWRSGLGVARSGFFVPGSETQTLKDDRSVSRRSSERIRSGLSIFSSIESSHWVDSSAKEPREIRRCLI